MNSSAPFTQPLRENIRQLFSLSFSFIFVLFSASFMGLCDRWMLARYSTEALEGVVTALFLLQLFQVPAIRIASIAQVFVGQYKGAGRQALIGPVVWQMIWFALFSALFLTPLSLYISKIYFQNTAIEAEGQTYFHYIMAASFLFPMGAALGSFYLGQGQTTKLVLISVASHVLHLWLDYLLIFGVHGWFLPGGVKGAALASIASQLFFCVALFWDFLRPHHRQISNTGQWALDTASFWKCLKTGLPWAGNKIVLLTSWVAITHIMISKGGDYLATLAFGGTVNLFYTCFNEGLSQSVITLGAQQVGARQPFVAQLIKSATLFLGLGAALLSIPLVFFPDSAIALFYKEMPTPSLSHTLRLSSLWLWALFITHGFNSIGMGLLTAYKDTLFQMFFGISAAWAVSYVPSYLLIQQGNAPPDRVWLIMAVACLVSALVYFLRLRQQKWKAVLLKEAS